jgi:PPP family 3-phenylpropionic acid transporter
LGETVRSTALPRFLLLYAAMYAAFGVASPFLPALVHARGVPAAQLGLVLSAGTAVRLLTAPLAGRLGDRIQGLRVVLVVCLGLAAVVTLGYLPAQGFGPFLALSLGHAAALAPVTILADALALGAAVPPPGSGQRGFEYGWVRGTGSAAFIGGTLLAGQAVSAWGLDVIIGLQALLLGQPPWPRAGSRNCSTRAPQRPWACRPVGCACCCGCRASASWYWWPPSSWGATPCTTPLR